MGKLNIEIKRGEQDYVQLSNVESVSMFINSKGTLSQDLTAFDWNFLHDFGKNMNITLAINYVLSDIYSKDEIFIHSVMFEKIFNQEPASMLELFKITMPSNDCIISKFFMQSYEIKMKIQEHNIAKIILKSSGIPEYLPPISSYNLVKGCS